MFNIKILLLCVLISYLNESSLLQHPTISTTVVDGAPSSSSNIDIDTHIDIGINIDVDMGTCVRRSLVDFEHFVHRRQQEELLKLRDDSVNNSSASFSGSLPSSSVPLKETKWETRPQHELEEQEGGGGAHDQTSSVHRFNAGEISSNIGSNGNGNGNHTVFYYYPSLVGDINNPPFSHSPPSPLSSIFLKLHDQFQLFYNTNTHTSINNMSWSMPKPRSMSHREQQNQQNRTLPQHVLLSLPYHYDITKSTEENYAATIQTPVLSSSIDQQQSSLKDEYQHQNHPHHLEFYGQYKDIRSTLDYNYHSNYMPSRQLLQDEIVQYILNKNNCCDGATSATTNTKVTAATTSSSTASSTTKTPSNQGNGSGSAATANSPNNHDSNKPSPWIVFTAGAMGAGKSYTMKHLHNTNRFPLPNFITIDPDEVRHLLPEYQYYIQNQTSSESLMEYAGAYTKKESGYICEIILQVALRNGCNVLMDGSLRDYQWYLKHFESLRYQFHNGHGQGDEGSSGSGSGSGINIAIIHVRAPKEAILERAKLRSKITKRIVPTHVLEESIAMVPKSVAILSKHVDFFVELYNGPDASDIEIMTEGVTWNMFRSLFYNNTRLADAIGKSAPPQVKTKNETKVSTLSPSSESSSDLKDGKMDSPTANKSIPSPSSKVPSPGMKVDKELDYQLLRLLSKL